MNLTEDLHQKRIQGRFRCDLCGQPISLEVATSLTYDYQGRAASFQACPTCLTSRTLLPEFFGKREEPPSSRR